MKRNAFLLFFTMACVQLTAARSRLDSLRHMLEQAPVQEKVYIHMDNTCYFKGDTVWYKAYVVRADNNQYTDMSRLMYVELVSPDGLGVERQQLIVSEKGYSSGDFALKDSLYSGFYELRAYTRWMLNFCVTEHPYGRKDREQFYNRQMAADFFRQYGTIYSRVFPVYERPDSAGDYSQKYIVSRPKQRLDKEPQPRLNVRFYPEGGCLIAGSCCRIAFEAETEEGESVSDLQLQVGTQTARTGYMGRGSLEMDIPENESLPKARCTYKGKEYSFSLPKVEKRGVAVAGGSEDGASWKFTAAGRGLDTGKEYGCAVLCRGQLRHFQRIVLKDGGEETEIALPPLPTGVNDFIVFDEEGTPLADRLFFVDNHDYGTEWIEVEGLKDGYQPYEQVRLSFHAPADAGHISISVRDASTDDPTYDTGSMMTELLLSSELKGFVAYPDYYFETDDEEHRRNLDLLMMVQGWRRYDFRELTEGKPLRYQPEKNMTVEGTVYKTIPFEDIEEEELKYWCDGIFGFTDSSFERMDPDDPDYARLDAVMNYDKPPSTKITADNIQDDTHTEDVKYVENMDDPGFSPNLDDKFGTKKERKNREFINLGGMKMEETGTHIELERDAYKPKSVVNPNYGLNHGELKKEVTVCGELVVDRQFAEFEVETENHGHFLLQIPPFYGYGTLFLSTRNSNVSAKKAKKMSDTGRMDETAWPQYYVKRNLFYPVFAEKFSFYQCHLPDATEESPDDESFYRLTPTQRVSTMDRRLKEIKVTARLRERRAIDFSKPAFTYDAYDLYNQVTDFGLSFGRLDFRRFPEQISMLLLGSLNNSPYINIDGRMEGRIFYRNYHPNGANNIKTRQERSSHAIAKNLFLKKLEAVRVYTDFELRNEDKEMERSMQRADVTLDFIPFPDGGAQYSFRDRRIDLAGIDSYATFYCPDYSHRPLPEQKDYRRTLYWNPNAKLDSNGNFKAEFYNGSREVRMKVSAEGLTTEGKTIINQ